MVDSIDKPHGDQVDRIAAATATTEASTTSRAVMGPIVGVEARPYDHSMAAVELDAIEQRVVGSLLEKERTVPDTYPMTINAVRTACNQTSGRDPVMSLGELDVLAALDRLRAMGLTRVLHPSHGARMPKHRQVLDEVLGLDGAERAVVTLLLLRGPQTPGELRSRSDRLHDFDALEQVQAALHMLSVRDHPLVEELSRQPGQKETRWVHCLGPSTAASGADEPTASFPAGATRDAQVVAAYDDVATDYAAQFLDELDGKPFDRWLMERIAELSDGEPVADVGCGPGQIAAHLAMAGADVTGFDLSVGMVDEARRRFPDLAFEVGDLMTLPRRGWAAITSWYSLVHHAPNELPAAVAAMASALRPGGWLGLAMHEGAGTRHRDEWYDRPVDLTFSFHERDAVRAAVADAGLEQVEWFVRGPSNPAETTDRLYVLARRPTT
jgi:uncharacterized protein YceH (UPF0502 family)